MNNIELPLTGIMIGGLKFSKHHKYPCLCYSYKYNWELKYITLDRITNIEDVFTTYPELIDLLKNIKVYNKKQKYILQEFKEKLSNELQLLLEII